MTGRDRDRPPPPEVEDLHVIGEALDGDDAGIVEIGPRRPPRSRFVLIVGLVLVAVAYIAGYHVGSQRAAPAAHSATASAATVTGFTDLAGTPLVTATGNVCAVQFGHHLQLGVEIINRSATDATLSLVQARFPLGGLRATSSAWGSCGELGPQPGTLPLSLSPNATAWSTTIVDVLIACPAPLPVLFTLHYHQAGLDIASDLSGFADLGNVSYQPAKCTS